MRFLQLALLLATIFLVKNVFAYGVGYSSYPWAENKKIISTEANGIMSQDGGVGLQARFTNKISEKITFDAGGGIQSGGHSGALFAGMDYELFPDYMKQPRFSVRSALETMKEKDQRVNVISVAPMLSKGFSMWNKEAYPYIAIPLGLALNAESNTYRTTMNLAAGLVGNLPFEGYEKLTAKLEATLSVKDSYSGVLFGVSYPIN